MRKSFATSITYPIYKKGDRKEAQSYRGISFSNATMKTMTSVLLVRLNKFVGANNLLSENQMGFRAGYSTEDNIFVLTSIAKEYRLANKKLYLFFIVFKATHIC